MRMRLAAAAILLGLLAAAAALGVWRFRGGSDEARLRAFFTLSTRTSCDGSAPSISVEDSRFSAFVPGLPELRSKMGKFLIVDYTVAGQDAATLAGRFALAAPSGDRYAPIDAASTGGGPAPPAGVLLFDVPQELGAAKLVFDDGCSYQEWLAP